MLFPSGHLSQLRRAIVPRSGRRAALDGSLYNKCKREACCPRARSPPGANSPARRRFPMHPAHRAWQRARRAFAQCGGYGVWEGCGPGSHFGGGPAEEGYEGSFGGGFGVRRPLRFLAHKLALNDRQVGELARILDELKTERAQAEVDRRRTLSAFADAVAGDTFDSAKAGEGG